ncbi:MAG TPA: glycine cleavage system aminomethyltransferase GcvT, partial [Polyangiaceae bacterium]
LGARLVPFAGFEMPVQYEGISAEHVAVRERAGLFDVSHMGELWLTGDQAAKVTDSLVTNDIQKLPDGKAAYTCCVDEQGKILDDLIVYRFSSSRVLVVCNASNRDKISGHFRALVGKRCDFDDASDRTALIALQGPKALTVLEAAQVGIPNVSNELGAFKVRDTTVAGRAVTLARTGYTGEDGVEIFCANEDATPIWTALLDSGKNVGIAPVGLGARDTLRLEARLALYGNDIDETTNPLEAGLGWVVKFDKPDFVGKAALAKVKAEGSARRLVGFEMTGRGVARHGYPLQSTDGKEVGICTSGAPSPTIGKSIGLGYLPSAMATVGTEFLVDCRGRGIAAKVVSTPFYKRSQLR